MEGRRIQDADGQEWLVSFSAEKGGAIGVIFRHSASSRAIYLAGVLTEEVDCLPDAELVQLLEWHRRRFRA